MPATDSPTTTSASPTGQSHLVCAACPHEWAAHDAIGRRFCSATIIGASTRGCVCVGDTLRSLQRGD